MKDIEGYEELYAITNDGRVWSHRAQRFLKNRYSTRGYPIIGLSKNGKTNSLSIHRLVAKAFVRNPHPAKYRQVNHKDTVKTNNHFSNLQWCTAKQNIMHAVKLGIIIPPRAPIPAGTKLHARKLRAQGLTLAAIAERLSINVNTVGLILKQ